MAAFCRGGGCGGGGCFCRGFGARGVLLHAALGTKQRLIPALFAFFAFFLITRPGPEQLLDFPTAVLLCLVKLKMDCTFSHLGYLFAVSESCATETFHRILGLLYVTICCPPLAPLPAPENFRDGAMPCFKDFQLFRNVAMILDCTEFFMQTASDLEAQRLTFSRYKHHNTLKVLVAIGQSGQVVFVALCYGGRISDKEITDACNFLKMLWPGAQVMVDKGFLIEDQLKEAGLSIVIPPMCTTGKQFSKAELESGRDIATVRIHVERVIGKAKEYRMLSNEVPISMANHFSKVVRVVFYLTNYTGDIVIPK